MSVARIITAPSRRNANRDGCQQRSNAKDQKRVADIASNHIPHGNPRGAGQGGLKTCHQFRRRCAEPDQSQANHHWRDAKGFGPRHRPTNQHLSTDDQPDQTDDD